MIEPMTTATRTAWRPRWVIAFLVAVLAVAVGLFGAGPASAATTPAAETRVGASHLAAGTVAGLSAGITAGQRLGNNPPRAQIVVATGVAAEAEASVVATERTAAQALKPSEAVPRWDEFLGEGPTTNLHPRTGLPDPNRIVSSDGLRSIRFGPHEMGSSPTRFHFHEESWSFDSGSNTWFVDNVLVRVPFPKGAW
jgi:hypothetical protein